MRLRGAASAPRSRHQKGRRALYLLHLARHREQGPCKFFFAPTATQPHLREPWPILLRNSGPTSKARTAHRLGMQSMLTQRLTVCACHTQRFSAPAPSSFMNPPFVTHHPLKRQFSTSLHPLPAPPCRGLLPSRAPLFVEPIHARLPEVDVVIVWRVRLHSLVRVASLWRSTCVCTRRLPLHSPHIDAQRIHPLRHLNHVGVYKTM